MPDEIVTIRIDFEANRRDMAQVLGELEGFQQAADGASDASNRFSQSTNRMNRTVRQTDEPMAAMNKRFRDLEQSGRRFGKQMTTGNKLTNLFRKSARLLFFQLIALVAEFVITAATLASVNLMFKLGQWALKGYNLALGAAGAALATVAVAASAAVAAFKEFNAAAAAWNYKGANIYGSATGAASAAMRGLTTDTNLATMGVTQLTQAYKTMSQQGRVTGKQTKALSGAMDFTARAQDQGKSFQSMANFVAILQKEGKVTGKATTAAAGVSKEFADAIKKSKKKDAASIMAAMASGGLAQQAGVSGEFGSIKGTLVSQFKQITVALANDMADFGDQFLNDVRQVLDGLYKNVRSVFARLAPEFTFFGKNKLFPAITTIGNALEKFSVTLVRKYLPMLFGASEWFKRTTASFLKSFNQFKHSLEKFREGSRIITETFKGPIFAIFRVFGRNAESLGYLAQDNEEQFTAWGDALERLVLSIGDWFAALKVAFTEALPVLTAIVNVLSKLISGMASLVRGVGTFKLGGGEGFLGMGGTGGGPSGTVGGGLGPGIGSLVTLGLLFGGFKGSRTAYRMGRGGSLQDAASQASVYAAGATKTGIFGGVPAFFDPKRYRDMRLPAIRIAGRTFYGGRAGDPGNIRLTPAEVAASQAQATMLMRSGRSYFDPGKIYGGEEVRGAQMMGYGGDRPLFATNRFERIGFNDLNQYAAYQQQGAVATSVSSQRLKADLEQTRRDVEAQPGFATMSVARQNKLLSNAQNDVIAQHMRVGNQQRDLMYGRSGLREFFRGGMVTVTAEDGTTPLRARRESIFKTLSGKRMQAANEQLLRDIEHNKNNIPMLARHVDDLALARNKSFQEFLEKDKNAGGKKFTDADGNLDAKKANKAWRAFAREQFKGRTGAMFKGVGEAGQASLRKTFNPMMGMMGGMLLSTGVTGKIGDKDMRSAANNALGVGAMFGARGMGIAAGVTLMKSTSTSKAMLGGVMAGAAVGKTIADAMGPIIGPPPAGQLARALITGGAALIGGAVGYFKAQGNRERQMKKIGAGIGDRMMGQVVAAMVGTRVNPVTGRLEQSGGQSYQRGISQITKQQQMIASMNLGSFGTATATRNAAVSNPYGYAQLNLAMNPMRENILEQMKNSGLMTKSDYKLAQEYLKQAAGGNAGAMKSFDSMVSGFQETNLGYRLDAGGNKVLNTQIRRAEDFMLRRGKAGAPVRGELYLPQEGLGRLEVADIVLKRGQFVTQHLAKMTGKTEAEIMQLASKMDVDLGDPTKSLTEQMGKLGIATRKTAAEMRAAITDIQLASLNAFDEEIAKRATSKAFTASFNNLKGLGETATIDDFKDFARKMTELLIAENPDNPFAVLSGMRDFAAGNLGAFGSMKDFGLAGAFSREGQAQAQTAYNTQLSQMSGLAMTQVLGGMAEQGFVFQNVGAADRLKGAIQGVFGNAAIGDQDKTNLLNYLRTGQLLDKEGRLDLSRMGSLGAAGQALSTAISQPQNQGIFATETSKVYEIAGDVGFTEEASKKFANDIATAITTAFDNPEAWEGQTPQWWSDMKKYKWTVSNNTLQLMEADTRSQRRGRVGDTSTSRALGATMAAHSRFNSMLTGKRTITSALRFDNLGSMSSDHAAGRAYDLTGDNLGQYQRLISKAGGFAEFHGRGSSRHLHVVPPIGGTKTSRVADASGGGVMNQNVTLNVYGAPGQSEAAIAKQVVAVLEQQRRAYTERI